MVKPATAVLQTLIEASALVREAHEHTQVLNRLLAHCDDACTLLPREVYRLFAPVQQTLESAVDELNPLAGGGDDQ